MTPRSSRKRKLVLIEDDCDGHSPKTDGPPSKRLRSHTRASLGLEPRRIFPPPRKYTPAVKSDSKPSAHTAAFHNQTKSAQARRRLFLAKHRALFLELLAPSQHKHFDKLINNAPQSAELKSIVIPADATSYKPVPQPQSVKGEMKSYQLTGLSFLVHLNSNGINGILGDEMGLGKTLQTLALLAYLKDTHPPGQPLLTHLVICPLSVLSSWANEVKRWTSFSSVSFHGGTKMGRTILMKELASIGTDRPDKKAFDIVITTYDTYHIEEHWFKHRAWGYVILDEGHQIKNYKSQLAQSLQLVRSTNRLILTGTPIQNNLIELWSLLHWLMPDVFPTETLSRFDAAFNLTLGSYDTKVMAASRKLLNLLMLRRTKEGVSRQLTVPPREEITLYVPMTSCQRFWTKRLLLKSDTSVLVEMFNTGIEDTKPNISALKGASTSQSLKTDPDDQVAASSQLLPITPNQKITEQIKYALEAEATSSVKAYSKLMNLLMQLRKVCNHPYLMPKSEPEPFEIAEHIVEPSSKLVLLDKLLQSELPKGKRILIFSGFTTMLNILEDFLRLRSIEYLRLDGSTHVARRNLAIRLFQQSKNDDSIISHGCSTPKIIPIFLISTKAGGLGINLTAADTVVMYDSSWNPQVDIQAIARAHRIGQTRKVTVYRLICAESVEQQMLSRLRKKLYLSLKIMDSGTRDGACYDGNSVNNIDKSNSNQPDDMPSMSTGDLCAILRGGTSSLHKHWGKSDGPDAEADEDERSGYSDFLKASFEEIVNRAKDVDKVEQVKLRKQVGSVRSGEPLASKDGSSADIGAEEAAKLAQQAEDEEMALLQGIEAVRTKIFEGKKYHASNREIADEWQTLNSKRVGKPTVTMIDGHAVESRSMTNERWQAVKTITSDPAALAKLQDQKRTRRVFEHEDACLVCHDGGDVYLCNSCPRVAHFECLGYTAAEMRRMPIFFCPQHSCVICRRSTADAGGLLYRCQTCPDSYCEDCLPPDNFYSMGDSLPEFLLLGYPEAANTHFIRCVECLKHFALNPDTKVMWEEEEQRIKAELRYRGIPFVG